MIRLLEYGSIHGDLLNFFSQPPYDVIFSPRERIVSLFEVMAAVEFMLPVLESLEYFKQEDFYTYRHMLLVFALSILLGLELKKEELDFMNGALVSPAMRGNFICSLLPPKYPPMAMARWILSWKVVVGSRYRRVADPSR